MDATYAVPTVVVNRFIVSTTPIAFRIVFGESRPHGGGDINFRVGVSMTPFEAYELRNVLDTLLDPFKEDIEKAIAAVDEKQASDQADAARKD